MWKESILFVSVSLAAFLVGCNKSEPGGPGASQSSGKIVGKPTDSFTISPPSTTTHVTQGQKNTVKVSVSRGKDFKQNVKLMFDGAKGVKFVPPSVESKASDSGDVSVEILAADDAPLGKQTITVKAKPESGSETTGTFDIDVEKK